MVAAAPLRTRALVLAGGLGTRLRAVISDRPKVLAPVGGRPFLDLLLDALHARGLRRVVLLLGYLHDQVEAHLGLVRRRLPDLEVATSVEDAPLGTAGAVRLAARFCDETVLVLNGDTWLDLDAHALLGRHRAAGAQVTIAVRRMADTVRYGRLAVDGAGRVTAFVEKGADAGPGLVSAGVYALEPGVVAGIDAGRPASLEVDVFPRLVAAGAPVVAAEQPGSFIDLGTPDGYRELEDAVGAGRGGRA